MDEETALLTELMLQAEIFCSRVESGADDLPDMPAKDEFRLKISQCRGSLSELQKLLDEDKLTIDNALTAATFRQLIMSLMWVSFRARDLVDYRLFRKLVLIESGFTYLLVTGRKRKS